MHERKRRGDTMREKAAAFPLEIEVESQWKGREGVGEGEGRFGLIRTWPKSRERGWIGPK